MSLPDSCLDTVTLTVAPEEDQLRIDKLLPQRYPEQSRRYFQGLIREGKVTLNGHSTIKRQRVNEGDTLVIAFMVTAEMELTAEEIPLDILYEDDHFLAVNKPAGMTVHPAPGNWSGTFVNALLFHCQSLQDEVENKRPGIVHRLDKHTSGVLLGAKTRAAHLKLSKMFAQRNMKKEYLAICLGNPSEGEIHNQLARHPVHRKRQTVVESGGRGAQTRFLTLSSGSKLSLVRLLPHTGRTHQLRVHMQFYGTPILGDPVYGSSSANERYQIHRQLLHAHKLSFIHPFTEEKIELVAPLPEDFHSPLKQMPEVDL